MRSLKNSSADIVNHLVAETLTEIRLVAWTTLLGYTEPVVSLRRKCTQHKRIRTCITNWLSVVITVLQGLVQGDNYGCYAVGLDCRGIWANDEQSYATGCRCISVFQVNWRLVENATGNQGLQKH